MQSRYSRHYRSSRSGGSRGAPPRSALPILALALAVIAILLWVIMPPGNLNPSILAFFNHNGKTSYPTADTTGTGNPTGNPTAVNTTRVEDQVRVDEFVVYGVQLAAYTRQQSADTEAAVFRQSGLPAYVYQDGLLFRILDAVYFDQIKATQARDRFRTLTGSDAYMAKITVQGVNLKVVATETQNAAIHKTVEAFMTTIQSMGELQEALETKQKSVADCTAVLQTMVTEMKQAIQNLKDSTGSQSGMGILDLFIQGLEANIQKIENIAANNQKTEVAFLGEIKYNLIDMIWWFNDSATKIATGVSTSPPTIPPTLQPSAQPTVQPTVSPTVQPTVKPTVKPTDSVI